MKKILPALILSLVSLPTYAYNNYWIPYALGGLITGVVIERAYNPPAPRYVVQPQPVYIAAPVYATPMYAPPPVYVQIYAASPSQRPYQPQASVLYFCGSNGLYYPQTPTCQSSWHVLPNY